MFQPLTLLNTEIQNVKLFERNGDQEDIYNLEKEQCSKIK